MNTKQFIKPAIIFLFLLIYIAVIIFVCRYIEWDADKANHLLQAKDIVSGNLFLRGWTLTGVSFITTDLVFYSIGYIFFGLSNKAIYTSTGLMISFLILSGLFVSLHGKQTLIKSRLALYTLLGAIPGAFFMFNSRVHDGAYIYTLFSLMIAADLLSEKAIDNKKKKILYITMFCLIAMGSFGDILTAIYAVLPILLFIFFRLITSSGNEHVRKSGFVSLLSVGAVFLALLLDKLYFFIGKANKNSYLSQRKFKSSEEWGKGIVSFFNGILQLSDSDFGNMLFSDLGVYFRMINALFLFISFIITITA